MHRSRNPARPSSGHSQNNGARSFNDQGNRKRSFNNNNINRYTPLSSDRKTKMSQTVTRPSYPQQN